MSIEIRHIEPTRSALRTFVHFPIDTLYRDNEYYVPALCRDELNTLDPKRNPAFEFCESAYFMAYRNGRAVGRIAGIINRVVNERTGKHQARFGYVDFIDDDEVVDGLIDAVKQWAIERNMDTLTGPLGFTDMDPEGCLIEGFDQLGTQATIYNFEYYSKQFERIGMVKETDWIELKVYVPSEVPPKMARVANIVAQRLGVHNLHYDSHRKLKAEQGEAVFNLINEAYDSLFGYSPLTPAQIDQYIDEYLPILPLDHISLIADGNDQLVGVGISLPSISQALIKCRGRLFPTGWYRLLRAIKGRKNQIVDLMLVAIKPEYQGKGVNALLFTDLIPVYNRCGYKWAESNVELEENTRVQQQWQYFDVEQHKRRRAYTMPLVPAPAPANQETTK